MADRQHRSWRRRSPRSRSGSRSRYRDSKRDSRSRSRSSSHGAAARRASRSSSRSSSRSRSRSGSAHRRRRASRSPVARRGGGGGGRSRRSRSRSYSRSRSRSPRRYRRSRPHSRGRRSRSRSSSYGKKGYRSRSPRYGRRGRSRSRSPFYRKRSFGNRENPSPSRCLGVFGLSLFTSEQELRKFFSKFGPIEDIQIVYDRQTGRSRGFCFVYFDDLEDAREAKEKTNGAEFDGRRIRVDYSVTKRPHTPTPGIYMGKSSGRQDYYRKSSSPHHGKSKYSRSPSRSPRRY